MSEHLEGLHNPAMEANALGVYLEGPAPLGPIHLQLQQGLTVLYGQNGSGKTRILQAVRDVLEGRRTGEDGQGALHVRVPPTKEIEEVVEGYELDSPQEWLGRAMLPDYTGGRVSELMREDWNGEFGPTNTGGLLLCTGSAPHGRPDLGWNVIDYLDEFQSAGVTLDVTGELNEPSPEQLPFHVRAVMNNAWDYPIGFASAEDALIDVLGLDDPVDLDEATRQLLPRLDRRGQTWVPHEDLSQVLAKLSEVLSMVRATLEAPARELKFNLGGPNDWLEGKLPRWEARTPMGSVPLDDLSFAEARWTRFCLRLALRSLVASQQPKGAPWSRSPRPLVLLLDEPERGLHRAAEFALAGSMSELSSFTAGDTMVVAASHSPAFLAEPRAHHFLVDRSEAGRARLSLGRPNLTDPDTVSTSERFGLRPSDLAELTRLWVFVEGPHDLAVLKAFLPETLHEAGAKIMVLGGAKALSSAANPIFLELNDAPIAVLLDKVGSSTIEDLWATAVAAPDPDEARRVLAKLKKDGSYEAQGLANMGFAAVNLGIPLSRFELIGLKEEDIIKYLPVEDFVPDAESWEQVLDRRPKGQSLKPYLQTLRGGNAEITEHDVWESARSAASRRSVPAEFAEVADRLRRLSGKGTS